MNVTALLKEARARTPSALARRFGVDPRALAALRVAVALLLLADLLVRAADLVAFYTDAGVLPRTALLEAYPAIGNLSLHALSGAAWFQIILFAIAGIFAVVLLVGYRTTAVAAVSLVLLVSLHVRNPVLLNAGDSLLRRLLFWGLFLPLGTRWSADTLRSGARRDRVATLASAALLVQVVIVYTVNGIVKLRGEHWLRGDAIRLVFGLDQLTVGVGDTLAEFPLLLEAFGWLWLLLVLSSVLLIVVTGRARALLVAAFAAAHLGMFLTMRLGLFPLISIAALLPFLPPAVWDAVERRVTSLSAAVDSRARGSTRFDHGNGDVERRRAESVGPKRWKRRFAPPVVAALLVLMLVWNASALGYVATPEPVASSVDPGEFRWDMFAPDPRTNDGWHVVSGRLESGRQMDAFRGSEVRWDRPPDLSSTYPSHRWFVYMLDLNNPSYAYLRPYFAAYLCERWNDDHEDEVIELTVYYVEERVRPDGRDPPRAIELHSRSCSASGG